MKIYKKIMLLVIGLITIIGVTACEEKSEEKSYVTVEINPGVEIVIDGNENVLAINGINDDGKTLIHELELEGLKLDVVIELVIKEAQECGYLINASYNSDEVSKNINISVSADTEKVKENIVNELETQVNQIITENNLAAVYCDIESKSREYFEEIVSAYLPNLSEEEVSDLSYSDLMAYVELATIEKASLASMALEEYYLAFKDYEFQLAYKKEIASKLKDVNVVVGTIYSTVISTLESAIKSIEALHYDIYVSSDSQYLKLVAKLNEYKDKNVSLTYQLGNNENGVEIKLLIEANNDLIDAINAQIDELMQVFEQELLAYKNAIYEVIVALEEYEKQVKNIDYDAILLSVEENINNTKNGLLSQFETECSDDIASIIASVDARKDNLKANLTE